MGRRRSRKWTALALSVAVVGVMAAMAATPGAAQGGDQVVFADDAVPAGGSTGVSGECIAADAVEAEVSLQSVPFGDAVVMTFHLDESREFDETFPLPSDISPGVYDVFFWCSNGLFEPAGSSSPVQVTQVVGTFEVLPYEGEVPVGLSFSPSTVVPWSDVTVSGRCIMGDLEFEDVGVHANSWSPAEEPFPPVEPPYQFSVGLPVGADGAFEGVLNVPGWAPPGAHPGSKFCSSQNAYYVAWSGSLEVLADATPPPAPPAPVPTQPRFTG